MVHRPPKSPIFFRILTRVPYLSSWVLIRGLSIIKIQQCRAFMIINYRYFHRLTQFRGQLTSSRFFKSRYLPTLCSSVKTQLYSQCFSSKILDIDIVQSFPVNCEFAVLPKLFKLQAVRFLNRPALILILYTRQPASVPCAECNLKYP